MLPPLRLKLPDNEDSGVYHAPFGGRLTAAWPLGQARDRHLTAARAGDGRAAGGRRRAAAAERAGGAPDPRRRRRRRRRAPGQIVVK